MTNICRSALVSFSSEQMFNLVNDVEKYPLFVPFCSNCILLSKEQGFITAKLEISKGGFSKSFTTRNQLHPNNKIDLALVNGPFKYLTGSWDFIPLSDQASKIELNLDFEFSSRLTDMAFSKIFNQLVQLMVAAFTERAKIVYASDRQVR